MNPGTTKNQLIQDIFCKLPDLGNVAKLRLSEYEFSHIPISQQIPEHWELVKQSANDITIRKKKAPWKRFEDKVWSIFYNFHFATLNKIYEPEILLATRKRFDVIASSENFVFFVECKTKEKPGKKSLRDDIFELNTLRNELKKYAISVLNIKDLRVEIIIAVQNINVTDSDLTEAHNKRIFIMDEDLIDHIGQLSSMSQKLGDVARYQFYALLLKKHKAQYFESRTVPAIQNKHGKIKYYLFIASPDDLLRIAYVHRRGSDLLDTRNVTLTYQRLLINSKLQSVKKYIENGSNLPFPNSIIINFNEDPVFKPAQGNSDLECCYGKLELPGKFGSAWIIDGQHRLFGYANTDKRTKDKLPVYAFVGIDDRTQANLFLDINQYQKAVSPNLLWDLRDTIYKDTTQYIIAKVGKRIAISKGSPLYDSIKIISEPSLGKNSALTLNTICDTLVRSRIVDLEFLPYSPNLPDKTVDSLYSLLIIQYNYFREKLTFDWIKGKDGFSHSANGSAAIIWLLRQVLLYLNFIEKSDLYRSKVKHSQFQQIINELYSPIVKKFNENSDIASDLREKRGIAGQKESANELCKMIKEQTNEFPLIKKESRKGQKTLDVDDLDGQIKNLEIKIRNLTSQTLINLDENNWFKRYLPGDVQDHISELVNKEVKNYLYLKEQSSDSKWRFDFTQLGDLKKIIIKNWAVFEPIFGSKSMFEQQMQNLIDIRNPVRGHPRQVDEVLLKMGDAAITWFNKIFASL